MAPAPKIEDCEGALPPEPKMEPVPSPDEPLAGATPNTMPVELAELDAPHPKAILVVAGFVGLVGAAEAAPVPRNAAMAFCVAWPFWALAAATSSS